MKTVRVLAALAVISALAAGSASAASVGFELNGHMKLRDFAKFSLTNTSTDAQIESMHLTIGDTRYNFDRVRAYASNGSRITMGDTRNGGKRFDEIALAFQGFDSGETTNFRVDIDRDRGRSRDKADYRRVLFHNGKAKNAVATVTFSNGSVLSSLLTENGSGLAGHLANGGAYRNVAAATLELPVEVAEVSTVPLPAALPLMLAGLVGLGLMARRRKS